MKKLLISIFLMMSMIVSGLSSMSSTPIASAINKSAVRCDFLGQYINTKPSGKNCEPCPVDFYCPLVSGTEIENCASKGYPESDCKETRKNFSTDKAISCEAGKTTKGFTFNTLQGTRITTNGDPLFPVLGQGATDKSMCQAPDFVCSGSTPVLLKGLDGVAKCFPANTCNEDQIAILKNGIPDCSVACKNETIVNGKCYKNCPAGQYLEVLNNSVNGVNTQSVNCKPITVKPIECLIPGQVPTTPGDIKTCACIAPQVYNTNTTKCEIPVVPCVAPQTGNQPNCVNPPANPCKANFYGYSEPNCKPCPINGTSPAGTIDSSGCVVPVTPCPINFYGTNANVLCIPCPSNGTSPVGTLTVAGCSIPVTPCPANFFGTNASVLCTPCPNNGTSNAGTQDASGCKEQPKGNTNNGGGDGFCGGWFAVLCGGVILAGVDCFLTKVVCNKPGNPTPPTPKNPRTPITPNQGVNGPADVNDILAVKEYTQSTESSTSCAESNTAYVSSIMATALQDAHVVKGQKYVWVATIAAGQRTEKMSTVKIAGGATSISAEDFEGKFEISELVCLMTRFAKKSGTTFSSVEYMRALKSAGVLHGLNKSKKLECLNLDNLLAYLGNYGEQNSQQTTSKTIYSVSNETKGFSYPDTFNTKEEAVLAMRNIAAQQAGNGNRPSANAPINRIRRVKPVRRVSSLDLVQKLANIFSPVQASALTIEYTNGQTEEVEDQIPTDPEISDRSIDLSDNNSISSEGEIVQTLQVEDTQVTGDYQCEDTNEFEVLHSDGVRSMCLTEAEINEGQDEINRIIEENYTGLSVPNNDQTTLLANGCPSYLPYITADGYCDVSENNYSVANNQVDEYNKGDQNLAQENTQNIAYQSEKTPSELCYDNGGSYQDEVDENGEPTGQMKCSY